MAQAEKTITGKIRYNSVVLSNVHVVNKNTKAAIKSDSDGNYKISASVGDVLEFSYVGLKTFIITVKKNSKVLNVEMTDDVNQLDDVVVKAKVNKNKKETSLTLPRENITISPPGLGTIINLEKSPYRIFRFNLDRLNKAGGYGDAIGWKRAGLQNDQGRLLINGSTPVYIVDDFIETESLIPDITAAKDLYVVMGKPPMVVIYTASHPRYIEKKKREIEEKYRNQVYYDSTSVSKELDFSQNDLLVNLGKEKEIYGKITYDNYPVPDVTVSIAGKQESRLFSNVKGEYKITAQVGDIIQFSHVSFETVSVFVEDVTEELNISLKQKINELNEVVVESATKSGKVIERRKKIEEEYQTSRGKENPKASGFSQSYVDGSKMSNVYTNIQEALVGKIPGYKYDRVSGGGYLRGDGMSMNQDYPVAWEVDGVFTTYAPPLDLSQIKSIRALKALGATNKYGSQANGGVIIIETTFGNFTPPKQKNNTFKEEYANSNYYDDDASATSLEMKGKNKFAEAIVPYANKDKAFQYYNQVLKNRITNYGDHLSVASKFIDHYNSVDLATKILDEQALKNSNNPEFLRSIAFYYQSLGNKRSAVKVYERLFKLRPKHAQSFRDLAHAYADYDLYEKAWKLYYGYIIKGQVASEEGIGETMYNEMEWLFYQRPNQTKIKQNFEPIHRTALEFERDVRMVFEWNTSEAEFELEFVSPDKRAYSFDHSLESNNELILDEKKIGYTSKMFVIENLGEGDWLVNLTYKGNKRNLPSFFKLTTYYNWGRPTEKKVVNVYKLEIQNQKAALLRFNRQLDVFQN